MLRNHVTPRLELDEKQDRPVTHKQVWDWIAIIRWALPGIVVAGLWVWNTSAVSAAREVERTALVRNQEELAQSMKSFSESLQKGTLLMEKWITVVEGHEKRLDKLEAR